MNRSTRHALVMSFLALAPGLKSGWADSKPDGTRYHLHCHVSLPAFTRSSNENGDGENHAEAVGALTRPRSKQPGSTPLGK